MERKFLDLSWLADRRILIESNAQAPGVLAGGDSLESAISLFMVQAIIILSICRGLGILGAYMKQPQVIFEIIGKFFLLMWSD